MALRGPTLFLAAFLLAGQASADVCSAGCSKGASNGGYQQGSTYTYWLEGNARVHLTGADNQETAVKISAQATVVGLGNCANLLKVSSLMITGPDGTNYNKAINVEKPVRFTLENGALGSQICAEEGDSQTSLNIKRAVLSLLQTSDNHENEVDVFGICPTTYSARKDSTGTVVSKTKNLNACAKREQGIISYLNPKANVPQSNVMRSTVNIDTVLKNDIVEKAEAHEEYLYVPFSVGSAGARASVNTKIFLKNTNKGQVQANCVVPKSIVFENPKIEPTAHNNIANIQVALQKASQSMGNVVDSNAAGVFANLVRIVRVSSKSDITNIYQQIKSGSSLKNNKLTRRVFLDALFRAGTGDSIEFTINLIKGTELTPFEKNSALLSLTTILHATSGSVKAAIGLLDTPDLPDQVYLGVGALAGVYCREHNCHGPTNPQNEITQLSQKLNTKLGNCHGSSKSNENLIIFALKAIKNIHHIDDCLIDKLASCAADKSVNTRVRVAALDAYSADPCIPKLQQTALDILKDTKLDSELRINAFLSAVKCPNTKVAGELRRILSTEPIYQVGSFITSYLRNVRSSANPNYDAAKQFFGNIKTEKKFPMDIWKYSQNYEMSYEHEMFGVGSFVEGNVIYSQNSFLPRSSSLNLTTEIFGNDVNLLEIGFRQGNLERLVEHFLGPRGVFNTETPQKVYDGVKTRTESVLDKLKQRLEKTRERRGVKEQTAKFGKQLKTDIARYYGDLELDFYLRLLGSDTVFLSLSNDHPASIESLIDKFFDYIDSGITDAKDFSHEVRSHLLILDLETSYPTSLGVALKLNGEAASTSKIQFSSSTDFKKLLNDPKNTQIDFKLVPSANVELAVSLAFDVDVLTTGLKVRSSLHTSTGAHVIAKLLSDGHGFDMKVELPAQKEEVISLDHDIIFVSRPKGHMDHETALKFDQKDWSKMQGCFDQLSNAIGLTVCGSLSVPWLLSQEEKNKPKVTKLTPKGPLSGPAKFSVHLEKDDLNGFHVVGRCDNQKEGEQSFELTFEALGSKKARKVGFRVESVDKDELKSLKATFNAPGKTVGASASIVNSQKEKLLMADWKHDQEHYYGKIGLNVVAARGKEIYSPVFEIEYPGVPKDLKVSGSVQKESKGDGLKLTFNDLTVSGKQFSYQLSGTINAESKLTNLDLKLKSNEGVSTLLGKTAVKKVGEKESTVSTYWQFTQSQNTNINFVLSVDVNLKDNTRNVKMYFVHGPDPKSKLARIDYEGTYALNEIEDFEELDFAIKEKLTYPLLELNVQDEFIINPKQFKIMLLGALEQTSVDFHTEVKTDMKNEDDLYLKLKAKYNKNGLDSELNYECKGDDAGNFNAMIEFTPRKLEARGDVSYQIEDDINVGMNSKWKYSEKPDEFTFNVGVKNDGHNFDTYTKFSVGSVDWVDFFIKLEIGAQTNGNGKLMIKDFVNGNGQLKVNQDKKGNAVIIFDMIKTQRKVKLEANFLLPAPHFNLDLDMYYDFNKDNAKKVTLSTHNKFAENVLDSKNFVVYENGKVDLTVKATILGDFYGSQKGTVVLSHSDGQNLKIQFDRKLEKMGDDDDDDKMEEFKGFFESNVNYVASKGEKPYTIEYKGSINTEAGIHLDEQVNYVNPAGKNMDYKLLANVDKKDKRVFVEGKVEVGGSLAPNVINLYGAYDYNDDITDDVGNIKYRLKGSYGPKTTIDATGSLQYETEDEKDQKLTNDINVAFTFPLEKVQNIKYGSKLYLFYPKDESYIETKSSMNALLNSDSYNYELDYLFGEKHGKTKLMVHVPNYDKFLLETDCNREEKDERVFQKSGFNMEYGKNQKLSINIDGNRIPGREGSYKTVILLPSDLNKGQKVNTEFNYKKANENAFTFDYIVDIDGEKYTLKSNTDFSNPNSALIDIKGICPHSKPFAIYLKGSVPSANNAKVIMKMENLGKFNLDMDVDTQVQSPDEFTVKVYVDCEQAHLNKIYFEAVNEASTKGTKKIEFSAKEDGKNILTGSTTYQSRNEGNKFTMEGSGSLKYRDEQKSTSFKYIKDRLSEGNEEGIEVFFNVAVGDKSYVIEHKKTNLIYKISHSYCEEKKQCAHFNMFRKVDNTDRNRFISESEVSVDLRKLGFIPEFGLQTKTELDRFRLPTHTFDIHVNLDKSKYHTQVYAKRVNEKYVGAFTVTMPHRIVSLESTTSYIDTYTNRDQIFPLVHETVLYHNKMTSPKTMTMVKALFDIKQGSTPKIDTKAELIFSTPPLKKDLQFLSATTYDKSTHSATVNLVLDVFKAKTQKIVVSGDFTPVLSKEKVEGSAKLHVDGRGLGFDFLVSERVSLTQVKSFIESSATLEMDKHKKTSSFLLDMDEHNGKILVKGPNTDIVTYEHNYNLGLDGSPAKGGVSLCLFGGHPLTLNAELQKKPYKLNIETGIGSTKLDITGNMEPQNSIELKVDGLHGKERNILMQYGVKVENKALKTSSHANSENIKKFTNYIRADYEHNAKQIETMDHAMRDQATKDSQRVLALVQGGTPDFDAVTKLFNKELADIETELNNDKSLQEFVSSMEKIMATAMKLIKDVTTSVSEIVERTVQLVTETTAKFSQVINERVIPEINAVYGQVTKSCMTILQALVDVTTHYVAALSGVFEKFSDELKPLIESLYSVFNELNQFVVENFKDIQNTMGTIGQELTAQLEPIISSVQEKWDELNLTEDLVGIVKTINEFALSVAPTAEVRDYINALSEYIVDCLHGKTDGSWAQIRVLAGKYDKAIESVIKVINFADPDDITASDMFVPLPLVPGFLYNVGKPTPASVSVVELLSDEDDVDLDRIESLNPADWIPPYKLRGIISGGQHIFTYDSRHLTFPGDCQYVVSQDALDGNFSIVMNLQKGHPKSITLVDKSGSEVTVNTEKKLTLNGAPYGFPLIKADTIAWKESNTFTIMSQYGVRVKCSYNLDICYFQVSGYYMGRLRGLLGDGNNEPFDDFKVPNGAIAKSEADFGNAYALLGNCPKVSTVDHSHHNHAGHKTSDICDEYFGEDSEMEMCDMVVNINNYRQACQHAVMGKSGDEAISEACSIAMAYGVACRSLAFPIDLPKECIKCKVGEETYSKGDKFNFETPSKQADIILAVETTKANEKTYRDMIVPLVSNIVDDLKAEKIDDVNVILVGVTPKMKYPIYYDTQNNKLQGCKIEFTDEQRSTKRESPVTTNIPEVDYVLNNLTLVMQQLEIELGINNIHLTYAHLTMYDLRPKAMKTMILVNSEPCWESETEFLQAFGVSFIESLMSQFGITTHLIAPFEEFKISSKPGATLIGFSEKHVFMLDEQKKPVTNTDLRSKVQYRDDVCTSYAEETDGNIYSSKNYMALNPKQKKVYISKVASTIVSSMTEMNLETTCYCTANMFLPRGGVKCRVNNRIDNRKFGSKK